jgi:signal transduction histidine kinase/CheY-like chemotaxis protein
MGENLKPFESMLHHLREPLLLTTGGGVIIASNVAGAEALATSVAALAGLSITDFSPEPVKLAAQLGALRAAGPPASFPVRSRDGRRFVCDANELDGDLLLLRLSGGPEPEQRLRAFDEALARLDGVTAELSEAERIGELARTVLSQGMTSLGGLAGGFFVVDVTGANLELHGHINYPEETLDRYRLLPLAAPLPLTDCVKHRAPVLLGCKEDYHRRFAEFTVAHPEIAEVSMACMPLVTHGRTVGAIAICFPMPWNFSDADRAFLAALAERGAGALERVRLADAAQKSRQRAERSGSQVTRLQAFTGALAQAMNWPEVVEAVVDMAMAATGAQSGELWILSADGAAVSLVRNVGPTGLAAEKWAAVPLAQATPMPILDTIRGGTPSFFESRPQMEEAYPATKLSTGAESSLTCLPLFAQGRCIGGLALNFQGTHRFDESERSFLQVMSWYSAQALERARLYAAERSARELAEANERRSLFLAHAGAILTSSLDFGSTLASVAAAAVPQVADWCIVELEKERDRDHPAAVAHVDPSKTGLLRELRLRFRAADQKLGIRAVLRTDKSELYPSISSESIREILRSDPKFAEFYVQTSAMVVPISARGQTLGAILLVSTRADRLYGDVDLAMAEELGRRAGIAVDNARLFEEARQADRLKDEFLAMLGHELRNPLTPIVTALDLMNLHGGEAFRAERNTISHQVRHVVRLVDDLLDVSRVTRGKIQLQREVLEATGAIASAIETTSPLFEQRSQRLTVTVPESGLLLFADQGRLSQAISNLLTNASKYTEPHGAIWLTACQENGEVAIRVRDTGIGIAPEALPTVFDLFVQAAGSIDRSNGGLGIGLTVVRSLVELHGGTVSAESKGIGHGSEFVIRLPRATSVEAKRAPVAEAPLPRKTAGARSRRVLLVDDNPDIAHALAQILEALGCVTRVAYDGPSAISAAASFEPELALLDIGLPVMDGYELARRLRRMAATSTTRLVAVTGYGQLSDRQRSHEAGFDEHIVKPFALDTIQEILARLESAAARS